MRKYSQFGQLLNQDFVEKEFVDQCKRVVWLGKVFRSVPVEMGSAKMELKGFNGICQSVEEVRVHVRMTVEAAQRRRFVEGSVWLPDLDKCQMWLCQLS